MSPWQQIFDNHQFASKLDGAIASLESTSVEQLSAADLEQFARLTKALKFARSRIKAIDPELVSQSSLNNLGNWLTNVANSVQNFASTKNPSYLQSANNTLDNLIEVVRSYRTSVRDTEQVSASAAAAFRDKAIEEIERVRAKADEVETEASALKDDVTQTKSAIEQQKGRLDQSIAEFQKQFSQSEADRAKEYSTTVSKLSEQVTAQIADFQKEFAEDVETRKEKGDQHLRFLRDREKQVNEIFGAIGSATLAGHFKNTADEQQRVANLYRWIALALMIGMVGIAAITFYHTLHQPVADWKLFTFRFATSLVLIIPALYAARESAKHRTREGRLRKSHLELASIDAYLALLPEEKRTELKEKLTEKFFGQAEPTEKDEMVTGHALLNVIEVAIKNLTSGK